MHYNRRQSKSFLNVMDELQEYLRKEGLFGTLMPVRDDRRNIYFQYHPTKQEKEWFDFDRKSSVWFRKDATYIKFSQK